jgi:hypothetical protein
MLLRSRAIDFSETAKRTPQSQRAELYTAGDSESAYMATERPAFNVEPLTLSNRPEEAKALGEEAIVRRGGDL